MTESDLVNSRRRYREVEEEYKLLGRPYKLVQTTGACPQQFDVYTPDGVMVGYIRIRHGHLRAEYEGEIVYTIPTEGDGFLMEHERDGILRRAVEAIKVRANKQSDEVPLNYEIVDNV